MKNLADLADMCPTMPLTAVFDELKLNITRKK